MTARYHIIHFIPDPFSGARVPLAAFVESTNGWRLAEAPHVPGPECLGGSNAHALLRMVLQDLRAHEALPHLPRTVGPQIALTEEKSIPEGIADPVEWVERHVLPQRPGAEGPTQPRGPHRDTYGYRLFTQHHVEQYVGKTYKPDAIGVRGLAVSSISHYVSGNEELLLMEPIVGNRAELEKDLTQVSTAFLAWQTLLAGSHTHRRHELIAYVFGADSVVAKSRTKLPDGARVVAVDNPVQLSEFISRIKKVGSTAPGQGSLPI
jgi:hypothetical protein